MSTCGLISKYLDDFRASSKCVTEFDPQKDFKRTDVKISQIAKDPF
jgi:hypothetical protein